MASDWYGRKMFITSEHLCDSSSSFTFPPLHSFYTSILLPGETLSRDCFLDSGWRLYGCRSAGGFKNMSSRALKFISLPNSNAEVEHMFGGGR